MSRRSIIRGEGHILNAILRLKERGDLFDGVLGKGIDTQKALGKLRKL